MFAEEDEEDNQNIDDEVIAQAGKADCASSILDNYCSLLFKCLSQMSG